MTDEELCELIRANRADNELVDTACLARLMKLANDYGTTGKAASDMLKTVAAMLHIALIFRRC